MEKKVQEIICFKYAEVVDEDYEYGHLTFVCDTNNESSTGELIFEADDSTYKSPILIDIDVFSTPDVNAHIHKMNHNHTILGICDKEWEVLKEIKLYAVNDCLRGLSDIERLEATIETLRQALWKKKEPEYVLPTTHYDVVSNIDKVNEYFKKNNRNMIFYYDEYYETMFGMNLDELWQKIKAAGLSDSVKVKSNIVVITNYVYKILFVFYSR